MRVTLYLALTNSTVRRYTENKRQDPLHPEFILELEDRTH